MQHELNRRLNVLPTCTHRASMLQCTFFIQVRNASYITLTTHTDIHTDHCVILIDYAPTCVSTYLKRLVSVNIKKPRRLKMMIVCNSG